MAAMGAVAVRTQYRARPGRWVIVVTDLASLRGPARGMAELTLRLFWSSPDRAFDLADPFQRRWLYQTVLREASRPQDLTGYLDGGVLVAPWPELRLPVGVRQAWEDHHPVLRAARGQAGLMPVSGLHARVALAAAARHGMSRLSQPGEQDPGLATFVRRPNPCLSQPTWRIRRRAGESRTSTARRHHLNLVSVRVFAGLSYSICGRSSSNGRTAASNAL